MNAKAFFVASLQAALDLDLATPEDVLRHVTPDVLAKHLPRPLWARLLTACVGAPRVNAQLVVETIGVPNLCEHVPSQLIWGVIADIAARALGRKIEDRKIEDEPIMLQPKPVQASPLVTPPPEAPAKPALRQLSPLPKLGPNIPNPAIADILGELEAETNERTPSSGARVRTPAQQRFRQSQTGSGIGRLAQPAPTPPSTPAAARRPQAAMIPPKSGRRGETDIEDEVETSVSKGDDWRNAIAVEDEQLVDWQASEETLTVADDIEPPRKR